MSFRLSIYCNFRKNIFLPIKWKSSYMLLTYLNLSSLLFITSLYRTYLYLDEYFLNISKLRINCFLFFSGGEIWYFSSKKPDYLSGVLIFFENKIHALKSLLEHFSSFLFSPWTITWFYDTRRLFVYSFLWTVYLTTMLSPICGEWSSWNTNDFLCNFGASMAFSPLFRGNKTNAAGTVIEQFKI